MDAALKLAEVEEICGKRIGLDLRPQGGLLLSRRVEFDEGCVSAVRGDGGEAFRLQRTATSCLGAGHDACYLARVCPTSMIFTPCVDGVSHNELEDIKQEWSTAGANVLMHAVLEKAEIA